MVGITGLLNIELPGHTARLTDGGTTVFGSEIYTAYDNVLGSLAAVDTIAEGIGDEIPALDLTFAPPSSEAVSALSSGAIQRSRVRLWLAEYDTATGEIVGTPDLRFIGFVDQPQISFAYGQLALQITAVPELEAMFYKDTGNGLSISFHKMMYPGELGHDNASGLSLPVAWGVESPARGAVYFAGGFGGAGGSFDGIAAPNQR